MKHTANSRLSKPSSPIEAGVTVFCSEFAEQAYLSGAAGIFSLWLGFKFGCPHTFTSLLDLAEGSLHFFYFLF
jgi:hypothetical protein